MGDLTLYNRYKHLMRTGDGLGWESLTFVGGGIRLIKGGDINHWSTIIRLAECEGESGERRYHTEALERGVYPNLLSKRLLEHNGRVWWYPLRAEEEWRREKAAENLALMWGTPYDYGSIIKQILGSVNADARRLFCSETGFIALGFEGEAPDPYKFSLFPIWYPRVLIYDGRGNEIPIYEQAWETRG